MILMTFNENKEKYPNYTEIYTDALKEVYDTVLNNF